MLDKNEITDMELMELKRRALLQEKKRLEEEILDLELKAKGFPKGRKTLEALNDYFKN